MRKAFYIMAVSFFLCHVMLKGQHAIGLETAFGKTLKIHPDFPDIRNTAYHVALSYHHYTTSTKRGWPKLYRYPQVGIHLIYESPGNSDELGKVISITPSMGFTIFRNRHIDVVFTWGMGLGWATRPFNKISNPENIAIGSHLNFSAFAKLHLEWKLSQRIRVASGLVYMHYSNGNVSVPNIGVNIPSGFLGVRYVFQPSPLYSSPDSISIIFPELNTKIHAGARMSIGFTQRGLDGPLFPVYTVSAGLYRYFGRKHKVSTGFEYVYHHGTAEFIRHIDALEEEAVKQASRFSWYLSHEAVFGHIGFLTEAGLYLNKFFLRRSIISNRIGFTFYGRNPLRVFRNIPYAGIYIHAVQGEAEFTELLIGFDF